jgi:hypothetical protein
MDSFFDIIKAKQRGSDFLDISSGEWWHFDSGLCRKIKLITSHFLKVGFFQHFC